ncbi:class I SAM-dependent methyltransferase, partial [Streptomyces nanhaiensis]|uniref:class I SAM-dependent methyltransferase n=1 Tax=Streptomyces nanhaiensis TaxID=679319 RepID=UPI00399D0808
MTEYDGTRVLEFSTEGAAGWDARFPDDGPSYDAAVAELGLFTGDTVLDAGCGTGRALPALRAAVGRQGTVLGVDLAPALLEVAVLAGRHRGALLTVADAARLPLRDGVLDAVFTAGLVPHLPDPAAGLRELARVVRPGGHTHPRSGMAGGGGRQPLRLPGHRHLTRRPRGRQPSLPRSPR